MFGIELRSNFIFPYFSRDFSEFWRRWHVSLSSWFRDYIYIPLGGSKKGKWITIRNIFIIFIISGFWHGANFTFIAWGLIHALLYLVIALTNKNRRYTTSIVAENGMIPSIKEIFQISSTFFTVMISWVFFRSNTITDSFLYLKKMMINFDIPISYSSGLVYVIFFIMCDWLNRKDERNPLNISSIYVRWSSYILMLLLIFGHGGQKNEFIYFQF